MKNQEPRCVPFSGTEKFTRLLPGVPDTAGMKSGYMILRPGESVGEHKTTGREEAIVILEGKAAVYVEQKFAFVAEAESLVYIPPEIAHDIKNETDKPLRYVYVVTPVGMAGPAS